MGRIDGNVEKKTLERKITESFLSVAMAYGISMYVCPTYIHFISNWTEITTFILYYLYLMEPQFQ